MAVQVDEPRAQKRVIGEETPLLRDARSETDDGSDSTLLDARESHDELEEGKANQQVGKVRALLIILSLWGLIFLQGECSEMKKLLWD